VKITRFERQSEAIAWAKQTIGISGLTGDVAAISVLDNQDQFLAVTLYSAYTRTNIDMHIAARPKSHWLSRAYFNASFELPFLVLEVPRITGLIRASNLNAQRFVSRLGFKYEGCMRRAFEDGEDLVLYGMLREEYLTHPWRNHANDRVPALPGEVPLSPGNSPHPAGRRADP
jgi:RimJ/RimL family protein N-acetyltransferase